MSKTTMTWTNGHGKEVRRDVKMDLNVQDFRGTPFYPWAVLAANPHLSIADVGRFLDLEVRSGLRGVHRPESWLRRKRWLMRLPGAADVSGPKTNTDGKDEAAEAIMAANPTMSAGQLVHLLKENGIQRSKSWVWMHRV
jgi:hypothetical protein